MTTNEELRDLAENTTEREWSWERSKRDRESPARIIALLDDLDRAKLIEAAAREVVSTDRGPLLDAAMNRLLDALGAR